VSNSSFTFVAFSGLATRTVAVCKFLFSLFSAQRYRHTNHELAEPGKNAGHHRFGFCQGSSCSRVGSVRALHRTTFFRNVSFISIRFFSKAKFGSSSVQFPSLLAWAACVWSTAVVRWTIVQCSVYGCEQWTRIKPVINCICRQRPTRPQRNIPVAFIQHRESVGTFWVWKKNVVSGAENRGVATGWWFTPLLPEGVRGIDADPMSFSGVKVR